MYEENGLAGQALNEADTALGLASTRQQSESASSLIQRIKKQ